MRWASVIVYFLGLFTSFFVKTKAAAWICIGLCLFALALGLKSFIREYRIAAIASHTLRAAA